MDTDQDNLSWTKLFEDSKPRHAAVCLLPSHGYSCQEFYYYNMCTSYILVRTRSAVHYSVVKLVMQPVSLVLAQQGFSGEQIWAARKSIRSSRLASQRLTIDKVKVRCFAELMIIADLGKKMLMTTDITYRNHVGLDRLAQIYCEMMIQRDHSHCDKYPYSIANLLT